MIFFVRVDITELQSNPGGELAAMKPELDSQEWLLEILDAVQHVAVAGKAYNTDQGG